jgi:4a-hydroxytetrahydrobiopterin dehydratase
MEPAGDLKSKKCVPCRGGIPPLERKEAERFLASVPGWEIREEPRRIEKRFEFDDFASALRFVNRVGQIAEAEGHHPDILFGWGYCSLTFYTHKIKGLHENDFIMAAKTDQLASRS